jgi:hypothetical protein
VKPVHTVMAAIALAGTTFAGAPASAAVHGFPRSAVPLAGRIGSPLYDMAVPAIFGAGIQNSKPDAQFNAISCPSAGDCTAAGSFSDIQGIGRHSPRHLRKASGQKPCPPHFAAGVQSTTLGGQFAAIPTASHGAGCDLETLPSTWERTGS